LQCGPLGNEVLISADWYVAAVFWGGIILLLLLMLTGRFGGLVICPLVSIGIYGYYLNLIGKIDVIFSYHAVLRGIAGLSLGGFIYFLVNSFQKEKTSPVRSDQSGNPDMQSPAIKKQITLPKYAEWILFVLANLVLTGVLVYTNFGRRCPMDFVVITLFAGSLFLLMRSKVECQERIGKVMRLMGKVTYPIYIFHMPIIELVLYLTK